MTETILYYKNRGLLRHLARFLVEATGAYLFLALIGITRLPSSIASVAFVLVFLGIHFGVNKYRNHKGADMRLSRLVERTSFPGDSVDDWLSSQFGDVTAEEARRLTQAYDEGYRASQRDAWRQRSNAAKRAYQNRRISP